MKLRPPPLLPLPSKVMALQPELAARYRTHRALFKALMRLAEHNMEVYVSAHRLALSCMRWGGVARLPSAQQEVAATGWDEF